MVPDQGAVRHHRPVGQQAAVAALRLSPGQPDRVRPGRVRLTLQGGTGARVGHCRAQGQEAV